MSPTSVRHRGAVALAAVLAASGCGAVLPKSERPDFFVLSAVDSDPPATPGASGTGPAILLGSVALPPYLDRRELVTRVAPYQIRVEDFELWAEPLRESVPRAVERDLAALVGDGRVQRLPWTAATPADLVVSIELRRFEKTSHQTVELEARWTIADGRTGETRVQRRKRLDLPVSAPGTQVAVGVMSDGLAELSRAVAADLLQLRPASPAMGSREPSSL